MNCLLDAAFRSLLRGAEVMRVPSPAAGMMAITFIIRGEQYIPAPTVSACNRHPEIGNQI